MPRKGESAARSKTKIIKTLSCSFSKNSSLFLSLLSLSFSPTKTKKETLPSLSSAENESSVSRLLLAPLEAQRPQPPERFLLSSLAQKLRDRRSQRGVRRQPRVRQPLPRHGRDGVPGLQERRDGRALVAAPVGGDDGFSHELAGDRADELNRRPRVQESRRECRPGTVCRCRGGELLLEERDLPLLAGERVSRVAGGLAPFAFRAAAGPAVRRVGGQLELREAGGDGRALAGGAGR